jgi:hypothetical protein
MSKYSYLTSPILGARKAWIRIRIEIFGWIRIRNKLMRIRNGIYHETDTGESYISRNVCIGSMQMKDILCTIILKRL